VTGKWLAKRGLELQNELVDTRPRWVLVWKLPALLSAVEQGREVSAINASRATRSHGQILPPKTSEAVQSHAPHERCTL
jgi:hypothetical protein